MGLEETDQLVLRGRLAEIYQRPDIKQLIPRLQIENLLIQNIMLERILRDDRIHHNQEQYPQRHETMLRQPKRINRGH